jgi:hypothetical protein
MINNNSQTNYPEQTWDLARKLSIERFGIYLHELPYNLRQKILNMAEEIRLGLNCEK